MAKIHEHIVAAAAAEICFARVHSDSTADMSKIALAQTNSNPFKDAAVDVRRVIEANLAGARVLIQQAADAGAHLLAFPEMFLGLFGPENKLQAAESLDGDIVAQFRQLAADKDIMLLLGSLYERNPEDPQRVYNTSVLIGADGVVLGAYRKQMLFDINLPEIRFKESDSISPGQQAAPVITTPIGNIGLSICFDLRFSHIYSDLRRRGAEIVFVPANFTVPTGQAHWQILLQARAIEGQFYVAAPAQIGRLSRNFNAYGHSLLIDPWGRIGARNESTTELIYAEVDLDLLRKVRQEIPLPQAME